MSLEEIALQKRNELGELIKKEYPFPINGDMDSWNCKFTSYPCTDTSNGIELERIPILGRKFMVWDTFKNKLYWQGVQFLNYFKENPFGDDDLKLIAQMYVDQAMKGEKLASRMPMYADILFEDRAGPFITPLITDIQRKTAVNVGFWDLLSSTADKDKTKHANRELFKLFQYPKFIDFFDWEEGVQKAKEIPINIKTEVNTDEYARWFLMQEWKIRTVLKEDESIPVIGKLYAPLIHNLIAGDVNDHHVVKYQKFASAFMDERLVKTEPVQLVLEEIFRNNLKYALDHYCGEDDFNERAFLIASKGCKNRIIIAKEVWEKLKQQVSLARVPELVEEYIPPEAYSDKITDLEAKINSTKRICPNLIRELNNFREKMPEKTHKVLANKLISTYINQNPRPNKNDLLNVSGFIKLASPKANSYLFMDLLNKKEFSGANEYLLTFQDSGRDFKLKFIDGAKEYVSNFKKLKIDPYALNSKCCYPKYNMIPHFVNHIPEAFNKGDS